MTAAPSRIVADARPNDGQHARRPGWLVVFLPSVTDLVFVLLFASMTYGSFAPKLLGDAGIGWHIRNGEAVLRSHHVPRVDLFSGTLDAVSQVHTGRPWFAWEWLFDAAVAAFHNWRGLNGVVLFSAFVISVTFAIIFRLTLFRGASLPIATIYLVLSFAASSIHLFARPHILTWLFLVIWFQILDGAEQSSGTRRLFYLPVLMLLWVNVHGGFILGFVLLALYMVSAATRWYAAREQRHQISAWIKRLLAVTLLCGVASLVNPYGPRLHQHVYQYLSDRWLMDHIDEFRSPNFHGEAQECYAGLLLITAIALASRRDKLRTSEVLVVLFAASSGLYASRNLPTASILLMLVTAPVLSKSIAHLVTDESVPSRTRASLESYTSFSSRMAAMEGRLRGHLWPIAISVIMAVICLNHGKLGGQPFMAAQFDATKFPVAAAGALPAQGDLLFAPDRWGGYLIYRLYPDWRVYVDDRHDSYGAEFLKDYLKIISLAPDWHEKLDQTHVRWVLVPEGSSLASALRVTTPWRMVYQDSTAVLFER